jgi:predicted transcriptional regulator
MYNANVSWEAMQNNLKVLSLAGLVSEYGTKNRKKYQITPKGERLVASYEEIIGTITEFMSSERPQEITSTPVVTYS